MLATTSAPNLRIIALPEVQFSEAIPDDVSDLPISFRRLSARMLGCGAYEIENTGWFRESEERTGYSR